MSKNKPTIDQIEIACRHVRELTAAGMTENHAIRTLELVTDTYAKLRAGESPGPLHESRIRRLSDEARRLKATNPDAKGGRYFRVEHGTPRRAFAKKVMELCESGGLTEASMNDLCDRYWAVAVITLAEDAQLNRVARSTPHETPASRWASAKITFTD